MSKKINIVLYSPEIAGNTGNISRTCSVTGAALHIIKPIGFEISDRTLKRAGLDYWSELEVYYYDSYQDFQSKHGDKPIYYFSSHAKRLFTEVEYEDGIFIMFGKESSGLPESLVSENIDLALRIPMREGARCLNLSNAVAVVTFEILRRWNFEGLV
ncbi:MAG: tRNA (cytidine(34)-2'-O)-methyltransferase [Clostridia bacterium]|nr:tRNA (cytidine(34)-2'-O)-methyltransferase [Clostridia bacterium]